MSDQAISTLPPELTPEQKHEQYMKSRLGKRCSICNKKIRRMDHYTDHTATSCRNKQLNG